MAASAVDRFIDDVRSAVAGASDPAAVVDRVVPLMRTLAGDRSWIRPEFYEVDANQGFGIVVLHEEPDEDPGGGFLVETICWAPGRGLAPHDHRTWGVVVGLDGREINVDWHRLDDGRVAGRAELEKATETVVDPGVVKTFVPTDIHSVRNDSDRPSLSLHVYGRNLAKLDRSEFNPLAGTETPCPKRTKRPATAR